MEKVVHLYYLIVHGSLIHQYNTNYKPKQNSCKVI